MVERHEVEMGYRLILGREAESEQAIQGLMRGAATLEDLRRAFLNSDEFRQRVVPDIRPVGKPLSWPPARVDTRVTDEQLRAMIDRVERNFRHMGETEPHWSVLSDEKFKAANIEQTRDEFFASGEGVVDEFRTAAARCGAGIKPNGMCFELGCGVGRSTIFLARHFSGVIGADVSAPHLELARQVMEEFGCSNVMLTQVDQIGKIEKLPSFDAFFSIIVLQHNPPPLIHHLLRTILGKLNPGGLAYFQVPTYALKYEFNVDKYLATQVRLGEPEMHVIPQHEVYELAQETRCRVLEVREDAASGWSFVSNRFLIQKR